MVAKVDSPLATTSKGLTNVNFAAGKGYVIDNIFLARNKIDFLGVADATNDF